MYRRKEGDPGPKQKQEFDVFKERRGSHLAHVRRPIVAAEPAPPSPNIESLAELAERGQFPKPEIISNKDLKRMSKRGL